MREKKGSGADRKKKKGSDPISEKKKASGSSQTKKSKWKICAGNPPPPRTMINGPSLTSLLSPPSKLLSGYFLAEYRLLRFELIWQV